MYKLLSNATRLIISQNKKLWELRGRVRVLTKEGLRYFSEQLFWDQSKHEIYSHVYSRIVTPERTLQGAISVATKDDPL